MVKFLKPGRVVVVLFGRYAGKKAIIVKLFEEGTKDRKFPHVLVAGLSRQPMMVSRAMPQKKILKRSRVRPFLKYVNLNHIMPTRYSVDIDVKSVLSPKSLNEAGALRESMLEVRKLFQSRYLNRGKNTTGVQYFYQKLRF